MVGSASCFGSIDNPTPHGGPPFQGWKNGWGFGKAAGPGSFVLSPEMPMPLRYTPNGDRCYSSSPFWRQRHELGRASSFGIGSRPDYTRGLNRDRSVAPNSYGDVSKVLLRTRPNVTRDQTMKPRFPTMEERLRERSWPKCGPGPGKYNIRSTSVHGTSSHHVPRPSWTIGVRSVMDDREARESCARPGPADYPVRSRPGKNPPFKHGVLYDISMHGRLAAHEVGEVSPGPARYNHKEGFDTLGFWEKIANIKAPPRRRLPPRRTGQDQEAHDSIAASSEAEDFGVDEASPKEAPRLPRTDSSPL